MKSCPWRTSTVARALETSGQTGGLEDSDWLCLLLRRDARRNEMRPVRGGCQWFQQPNRTRHRSPSNRRPPSAIPPSGMIGFLPPDKG